MHQTEDNFYEKKTYIATEAVKRNKNIFMSTERSAEFLNNEGLTYYIAF